MRVAIRMPQLGEAAAEATVVAWLVQPGSPVKAEQELVEVQTEKSLLTVAAPADGVLTDVGAKAGDVLKVGDVLGYVADPAAVAAEAEPASAPPGLANVHDVGAPPKARVSRPVQLRPSGRAGDDEGRIAPPSLIAASGERGFLSPRVRAKVAESGLKTSDLSFITGTGAGGRITAADIDRYLAHGEPMPPIRQAVAAAMSKSWTRPLATVATTVQVDSVLAHRRTVAGRPSLTIYALRALALGLRAGSPFAKRLYGNRLHTPATVDLAVAVEVGDGVLTPVIRKVDELSLPDLTTAVESIIEKARAGKVSDGGEAVASVSNYGVFGLTWATPIPLPGHSVILGLSAPQNQPDWNPATKSWDRVRRVELTLTFDHRIADGGDAARLINRIAELLSKPERL
jgi:pyruvate/2-oxoglutarate dehydrogenase complex dihydrolipoamide acyltransferase (E2) component